MTIEELQQKMQSGQPISEAEQKEFLTFFDAQLVSLKRDQPEQYMELLKELTAIARDLNKAVQEAQA